MNRLIHRMVLLVAAWGLFTGLAVAQRTISGTVTDKAGEPLIGVNILAVGTSVGTVSDFDGTYTLTVPAGTTEIQFSYTGYERIVVALGASDRIDVMLGEGAILEDVVVTGYGTVKREDVTGAIATVSKEDFNRGSITGAAELIAGKVPGVSITTGGDPGGGSVIRIRGGSSLSATNDPLIVIDGIPISDHGISGSRNVLNIINPNDIETFTVLKDASATAIYGSRASNGVIIITTKKGSVGRKFAVEYNGFVSISTIAKRLDVLAADDYRGLVERQYGTTSAAYGLLGDASTDWQDEIYQSALSHDHNLNLSGAAGELPYRISLGYTNKDGLLLTDNFNRLTGAINLSPGFLDNTLQLNLTAKAMLDNNNFANRGAIGSATFFDPTQPVFGETDAYGGYFTWTNPADGSPNTLAPDNPLALIEQRSDKSKVRRMILGAQIDYRLPILDRALRANLNLGLDRSHGEGDVVIPDEAAFAWHPDPNRRGRVESYWEDNKNDLLEFFLDYSSPSGRDVKVDLMAGYSWQHFYFENFFEAYNTNRVDTFNQPTNPAREYYLVSLFGRANITLFDDFLVTLTLRRDGTSRFSEDNRWGNFPGVALAWKAIDNTNSALNTLKFRVGYGITGQQGISNDFYPYLPRYLGAFNTAYYQFGNEFIPTLRPEGYDSNIKWEETENFNVGIDYGILKNRINGSIDYYIRKTTDLINFVPVAAGTNLTNYLLTNVGDLENRGIEFAINAIPWQTNDKEFSFGFNFAYNQNEITRLTATDDPNYQGVFIGEISGGVGNSIQVHSVGYPANSFFVYEQVYDANGIPIEGLYVDRNGDGVVTPDDRYRYQQAAPKWTFGFNAMLDLGPIDISTNVRAVTGNYVYNNNLSDKGILQFIYGSSGYLSNVMAQAEELDIHTAQYFSDHYVQNGAFLRVDHVTVGYDVPLKGNSINRLRLFGTVQNPILITGYDGIDPEVFGGIDNNIYPRSRTFLFGLNLGF